MLKPLLVVIMVLITPSSLSSLIHQHDKAASEPWNTFCFCKMGSMQVLQALPGIKTSGQLAWITPKAHPGQFPAQSVGKGDREPPGTPTRRALPAEQAAGAKAGDGGGWVGKFSCCRIGTNPNTAISGWFWVLLVPEHNHWGAATAATGSTAGQNEPWEKKSLPLLGEDTEPALHRNCGSDEDQHQLMKHKDSQPLLPPLLSSPSALPGCNCITGCCSHNIFV